MLTHKLNTNFRLLMVMDENIEKDGAQSPLQVEPISGVFSKFCPLASSPTLMHIFKSSSEVSTLVSPKKTTLK